MIIEGSVFQLGLNGDVFARRGAGRVEPLRPGSELRPPQSSFPAGSFPDLVLQSGTQSVGLSMGEDDESSCLVALSAIEFALLEYLARCRVRAVSHVEMNECVLGAPDYCDSSIVRVHLMRIKKKLGLFGNVLVTHAGRRTRLDVGSVRWS